MSHLVWAAPALLDQDRNHLIMVFRGSKVYWKKTLMIRQECVSPYLKKFLYTGVNGVVLDDEDYDINENDDDEE